MDISSLYQLDNWHGPLQVFEDWFIVALFVFASELLRKAHFLCPITYSVTRVLSFILYVVTVVVVGCRMRALAELLHQASHHTLCKSKSWNNFLGTVFCGWPILYSFSVYKESHDRHHQELGDASKDPDFAALKRDGLYDQLHTKTHFLDHVSSVFSVSTAYSYLCYLWINRICADTEKNSEKLMRMVFYSLFVVVLLARNHWFSDLAVFFAYWIVPLITSAAWVGNLIELLEHYPLMEDVPVEAIYTTRNRVCPPWLNFFVGIHQEGFHLVHHLFPRMPAWRLTEAHNILLKDACYAKLHIRVAPGGWGPIVDDILTLLEVGRGKKSEIITGVTTEVNTTDWPTTTISTQATTQATTQSIFSVPSLLPSTAAPASVAPTQAPTFSALEVLSPP
jgi:fatty acid desaturase